MQSSALRQDSRSYLRVPSAEGSWLRRQRMLLQENGGDRAGWRVQKVHCCARQYCSRSCFQNRSTCVSPRGLICTGSLLLANHPKLPGLDSANDMASSPARGPKGLGIFPAVKTLTLWDEPKHTVVPLR